MRLLDGDDVVARHARSWAKHQRIEDPEHRRELLEHKRAARTPKMRDRLLAEITGMDALYTGGSMRVERVLSARSGAGLACRSV